MGYGSDYGYQYNVPVAGESQSRRGFSLADFGKEVLTGAVTGGLASAAFYGAGKAVGALKESIKNAYKNSRNSDPKLKYDLQFFAENNSSERKTLYHYTNEKGMKGIVESQKLNPSLRINNPKDVRYGNGQYLSDINPVSQSPVSLAKKFMNIPNKYKYTNYVEIDISDLDVIQGREGVFVIPNDSPLSLVNRIVSTGKVGKS